MVLILKLLPQDLSKASLILNAVVNDRMAQVAQSCTSPQSSMLSLHSSKRFYPQDDSAAMTRHKKEKSKLSFVDGLIKIFMY